MKPLQIQGSRFASIEILIVIAIIAILCPPHVSDEETFALASLRQNEILLVS
jgi:hypothetical protein